MTTLPFPVPGRILLGLLAAAALITTASANEELAALQASLKGTWQSVPMDVGHGTYIRTTSTYDGAGGSSDIVRFYKDPACTIPTGLVKTNSNTYLITKKVNLAGGKEAWTIDITTTKWQLKQGGSIIKNGGAVPTQYDIIKIDGDTLSNSGLTRSNKGPILNPADRPTTLDDTNVYKRM